MSVNNIIDIKKLFKDEITADIYFTVHSKNGIKIEIPAHKLILKLHSTVFEKMFYGDLKEKGPIVTITDVYAEAFEEFLRFFYIAKFDLTTENLQEVFKLIDKYDATSFWPVCETFLEVTGTADVAYFYYELATMYNLSASLALKLEEIICQNPKTAFRMGISGGANRVCLANILQSKKLICSEMDIFDGVMSWAETSLNNKGVEITTENIRNELGDCLYLLRFPIMSSGQFLSCIEKYLNLMPPEEYLDILKYIAEKRALTVASRFSIEPRQTITSCADFRTTKSVSILTVTSPQPASIIARLRVPMILPLRSPKLPQLSSMRYQGTL